MRISRRKATVFAFAVFYLQSAAACYSLAESNLPNAEEPKAAKIQELEKERELTLRKIVAVNEELRTKGIVGGGASGEASFLAESHQAERAWLNAQLNLSKTDPERVAVYDQHLKLAKAQEDSLTKRVTGGVARDQLRLLAKGYRLGVEIDLERAKAKAGGQPIPPDDAKDVRVKKLAQEQVETLRKAIALDNELRNRGITGSDNWLQLAQNQRALLTIKLALCENDKERVAVVEKALTLAKRHEDFVTKRVNGGIAREQSVMLAKTNRLEFEIELEKAKATAPK